MFQLDILCNVRIRCANCKFYATSVFDATIQHFMQRPYSVCQLKILCNVRIRCASSKFYATYVFDRCDHSTFYATLPISKVILIFYTTFTFRPPMRLNELAYGTRWTNAGAAIFAATVEMEEARNTKVFLLKRRVAGQLLTIANESE